METTHRIRMLINRLARIDATGAWTGDLNPTQKTVLEYLARANRFSRSPSHVADYVGTTRGTMSQTLKALMRKGYVTEQRQEADQRSISYALTEAGAEAASEPGPIARVLDDLPPERRDELDRGLSQGLALALKANGGKSFEQCRTCAYHDASAEHGFCTLLNLPLEPDESLKICVEHCEAV